MLGASSMLGVNTCYIVYFCFLQNLDWKLLLNEFWIYGRGTGNATVAESILGVNTCYSV